MPTLVDPPREDYESWEAWQAAVRANAQAWEDANQRALSQREQLRRFWTPLKKITVQVWLYHTHQPFGSVRKPPKGMTRKAWRQDLFKQLRKVHKQRLRKGNDSSGWKWLCLAPETRLEDIVFLLVLYLLQEQMLEMTPDIAQFLQAFFKRFNLATQVEERDLLDRRCYHHILEGGGRPLVKMLKNFVVPADWRTLRKYIGAMLTSLWTDEQRKAAKQGCRVNTDLERFTAGKDEYEDWANGAVRSIDEEGPNREQLSDNGTQTLYTVDEAIIYLHDVYGVVISRSTLYNWINRGTIPVVPDGLGRRCLNKDGMEQIRARLRERYRWKALKEYSIEVGDQKQNKDSQAAAKKRIQRHRKRGAWIEDIVRGIHARR